MICIMQLCNKEFGQELWQDKGDIVMNNGIVQELKEQNLSWLNESVHNKDSNIKHTKNMSMMSVIGSLLFVDEKMERQ